MFLWNFIRGCALSKKITRSVSGQLSSMQSDTGLLLTVRDGTCCPLPRRVFDRTHFGKSVPTTIDNAGETLAATFDVSASVVKALLRCFQWVYESDDKDDSFKVRNGIKLIIKRNSIHSGFIPELLNLIEFLGCEDELYEHVKEAVVDLIEVSTIEHLRYVFDEASVFSPEDQAEIDPFLQFDAMSQKMGEADEVVESARSNRKRKMDKELN